MDKKERNICSIGYSVGTVSLLVYCILTLVRSNPYLLAIFRLIFAGIAAISYAIKLGVETSSKESCEISVYSIALCLLNIMITAMELG